jgi:hypothetical protein
MNKEAHKHFGKFIHHDPIFSEAHLFCILPHLDYNKFQFELEMPAVVSVIKCSVYAFVHGR